MTVFARTVEGGSFTAAAAALGMSAQMAGRHVTALERRLGVRLLNRSTRSQSLTEAGRLYLERCRQLLADADAADALVMAQGAIPRGTLRVTAPSTFGARMLVPEAARFLDAHPEMRIDLDLSDRTANLIEEGFDVAIRLGALVDSTLVARPLRPYRIIACAAPAYLDRHGTPTHPDDLAHHSVLDFAFPAHPPPLRWQFERDGRHFPVAPAARLRINDGRALIEAALAGFGIVLLADTVLERHIAAGELVPVLQAFEGASRPMSIVFPASRAQPPKLRAFIDWMTDAFGW